MKIKKTLYLLLTLELGAQTLSLETAMAEFNSGTLSADRLGFWANNLAGRGPRSWGVTPAEYVSILVSLRGRFVETAAEPGAIRFLENGLKQLESEIGASAADLLPLLDELSGVYDQAGRDSDSAAVQLRALAIAEASFGDSHPSLIGRLRILGQTMTKLGERDRASALGLRATALEAERRRQLEKLTSMGPTPDPGPLRTDNAEMINVYYATNRAHGDARSPTTLFGTRRDPARNELSYGQVTVSVPREFEVRNIKEGRYWVGEIRKGDYRKAALVDLKEFESQKVFLGNVRDRLKSTKRRELMLYIHGYSTDWRTAVQRTAALAVALELDGAPLLFSWPSRGDVLSYAADGNELTSLAVEQLASLLSAAIESTEADKIYVISHSMGARFLLSALERIRTNSAPLMDSLVFASPDVDGADFARRLPVVSKLARRSSIYVSENDRALRLSNLVNDSRRAGDAKAGLVFKEAETINTTRSARDLWSLDGIIGHNDFATGAMDDLRAVIWHGLNAGKRCILVETTSPAGTIWALRPPDGCSPETFKMGVHASRRLGASEAAKFLAIQETESCRNSPRGEDCLLWRESRRVAETIPGATKR